MQGARLLAGGTPLDFKTISLPILAGMAETWMANCQMSFAENTPVDDEDRSDDIRKRRSLTHLKFPVFDKSLAVVVPLAPGSTPGDRRDVMFQTQYRELMRLRERKRLEQEAREAASGTQGLSGDAGAQ